jgi:uncharacterized protein involved in outer membrane biogenesis
MKPRTKKLLVVLAALVATALVALLLLPRFIDADSFRPVIERIARERLGRDVTLGRFSVTFLPPSVVVDDVSLAGGAAGPPWFHAKSARVRAALGPMFSGRLEVRGVDLDEPSFRLLRSPDGRWNLLELARPAGAGGGPSKMSIDAVSLRGAHVEIADAFVSPGSVVRHEISGLDARIDGLSSPGGMDVEVSAEASSLGGHVAWKGRVGPEKQADGHLQVEHLDLLGLGPYLKGLAVVDGARGRVTLDLRVARDAAGGAHASGTVSVADFLLGTALAGARPVSASADIDAGVEPSGRVSIGKFDLTTGQSRLAVSGNVEDHAGAQVAMLSLAESRARLSEIVALTAATGVPLPIEGLGAQDVQISGNARVLRDGDPKVLREVALDGVRISGPRLVLVKGPDGEWHLPGATKAAQDAGPRLLVRDLNVDDATLTLQDRSQPGEPRVTTIDGASLAMESWAPGKPGRLSASARVAGGSVKAQGIVSAPPRENEEGSPWDLDVVLAGIDLAQLPASPQGPRAGRLDAHVALKGVPGRSLSVAGHADLAGGSFTLEGGRRIELAMPVDVDALMERDGRVTLRKLGLSVNGSPIELSGRVKLGTPLEYDIGTSGPTTLTPQAISGLIALAGTALPVDLELTEPVQVDMHARSTGGPLELEGHAELRHARLRHALLEQPLEIARAIIDLRGDHVAFSDTALRLGATTLSGALTLTDFEEPRLEFDLESEAADLDELFAIAGHARDVPPSPGDAGKPGLVNRLRAKGSLAVRRATFGGLELSDFTTEVDLHDAHLVLEPIALKLYSGTGSGRGVFDMSASPLAYAVDVALDGLDVQALLGAGIDYRDFSGSGHLEAKLEGSAGSLEDALRAVHGSGSARLRNGVVGGLNVLSALEKAGVFGEASLAALGARLSREGLAYDSLDGAFTVSGGTLHLADVVLDGPDARMTGDGDIDMISTRIDLDAVVLFSETLSNQMRQEGSRAAEIFWDDKRSRVMLPARLTGTARAPQASIDWNEALGRVAARKFEEALRGRASGPSGASSASGPSASQGSQAQDLLGRLLGGHAAPRPAEPSAGPAQGTGAAAEPAKPEASASPGAPSARIDEARRGGSVLAPDLKLKATISGVDLSHAVVVISEAGGREIQRLDRAFESEITAFYATAPRDRQASIAVKLNVDGRKLLGAQGLVVAIVPVDASGRRGSEVTAEVASASLF